MSSSTRTSPLFPLNTVLFPRMALPLRIFEPRYVKMVDECVKRDSVFGVVLIKEGTEVGAPAVPHRVGTTARILGVEKKGRGLQHITTVGEERFRVRRVLREKPYLVGEIETFPLERIEAPEVEVLIEGHLGLLSVYLELLSQVTEVEIRLQHSPNSPQAVAYFIAMLLQLSLPAKQRLLSIADLPTLLHEEAGLLRGDITALDVMLRGQELIDSGGTVVSFSEN